MKHCHHLLCDDAVQALAAAARRLGVSQSSIVDALVLLHAAGLPADSIAPGRRGLMGLGRRRPRQPADYADRTSPAPSE